MKCPFEGLDGTLEVLNTLQQFGSLTMRPNPLQSLECVFV